MDILHCIRVVILNSRSAFRSLTRPGMVLCWTAILASKSPKVSCSVIVSRGTSTWHFWCQQCTGHAVVHGVYPKKYTNGFSRLIWDPNRFLRRANTSLRSLLGQDGPLTRVPSKQNLQELLHHACSVLEETKNPNGYEIIQYNRSLCDWVLLEYIYQEKSQSSKKPSKTASETHTNMSV